MVSLKKAKDKQIKQPVHFNRAGFFLSDSQRRRVGKRNLVFGSRLVALISGFILLSSVGVGAFVLNKSETSSAAAYYYTPVSAVNPPGTMVVGQTAVVTYVLRNDGSTAWYGEGSANPTRLGTSSPNERASPFYSVDAAWIGQTRIRMQESVVNPGQNATFRFVVTARTQGSFTENFNLVTDGIAWHPSRGLFFAVNVPPPTYTYDPVSAVNPPGTMETGQTSNVSVTVRNTGNYVWYGEGSPNPVRLATSSPNDRASGFAVPGQGWLSSSRIRLSNGPVLPGQNAVFNFTVEAPLVDGSSSFDAQLSITERFNVVAEGKAWMPDRGLFFTINTLGVSADLGISACLDNFSLLTNFLEAEKGVRGGNNGIISDSAAPGNCRAVALYGTGSYVEQTLTVSDSGTYQLYFTARGRSFNNISPTVTVSSTVTTPTGINRSRTQNIQLNNPNHRTYLVDNPLNGTFTADYPAGSKVKIRVTFVNDASTRDAFVDSFSLLPIDTSVWISNETYRNFDMPDQTNSPRVHVVYAVPASGAKDRKFDINGSLITSLKAGNNWLKQKSGKSVRFDQHQGKIDISYFQLQHPASYYQDRQTLRKIYNEVYYTYRKPNVTYLIFAEVNGPERTCGEAFSNSKYALVYLKPTSSTGCFQRSFATSESKYSAYPDLIAYHELVHAAGHVKNCAPNAFKGRGHVKDDPTDLMYNFRIGHNLDVDRKDYMSSGSCGGFMGAPFLQ